MNYLPLTEYSNLASNDLMTKIAITAAKAFYEICCLILQMIFPASSSVLKFAP